jgi:23S rRNA (cytidine1920-2'-O)/16S rRNA (cytidine1409-2'-O)-methyltransferase
MRLDVYLTQKGFEDSRERAKALITGGNVTVDGAVITKPAFDISETTPVIEIQNKMPYVGRGGLKLQYALNHFGIELSGKKCLDIGASTGGFTDCMLSCGAKSVICIDVGSSQLHSKLREDERVTALENTDFRRADSALFDGIDFLTCDVSFISVTLLIPKMSEILRSGEGLILVKPQFEAGMKAVGKNGIVKSEEVRRNAVTKVITALETSGFRVCGDIESSPKGTDGNIEYMVYIKK